MPRPLRVGVQLPEVERIVRWPELVALARTAESVGFDSVWVGDHLLYRDDGRPERGPYDAWSILAGLACCTSRVEIGPLVTCLLFRPAPLLARMAQAVDEMSGGRLVLGVGCGWNRAEFDAFGIDFANRVERFEESFDLVRRLLEGERVTTSGHHVEVEDAVLHPAPLRRPPLMVGSNGSRMLAATLGHVDRWNTWWDDYGNTVEGFSALNASISAAAESAGRAPDEVERSACVLVVLDPSSGERSVPPGVVPLEGGPREIASELSDFAMAGADEVVLVLSPINFASLERIGEALRVLDG